MEEKIFKILSYREERQLSAGDFENYCVALRKYVLQRKLQTTTKGAITVAPKLKPFVNKVAGKLTSIMAGGEMELIVDGIDNIPNGAVIYANTHQGILDNFCWISGNPKHSVMLHASGVNKLLIMSQLWTGLVLVNKEGHDAKSRTDAKLDMMNILMKGHSVWYFPEGTWNLSPNKLHLPMSFGFLDVAQKAGVPVVPVVTEFTYDTSTDKEKITKTHIRYGSAIYVTLQDNLGEKLAEYEEAISTIRWNLIEEKGFANRRDITNWHYINFLKGKERTLKLGNRSIDLERKDIRGIGDYFYKLHHINDVPFNEDGELLDTEESIRLARLFDEHVLGIKCPVEEGQ